MKFLEIPNRDAIDVRVLGVWRKAGTRNRRTPAQFHNSFKQYIAAF